MGEQTKEQERRIRPWGLFVVAALFAVLAGIGTLLFLHLEEKRLRRELTPKPKEMTEVVVANRDLEPGTKVDTDSMAVRSVPSEYVGDDVILPGNFNAVAGAVLTKKLAEGKMLTEEVIDLKIPRDFAGTVREGFRAITIQVDEINSMAELIRPGNRVDLYSRLPESTDPYATDSGAGGLMVIPVLEDVLVLATGKTGLRPNEDEFRRLATEAPRYTYTTLTLEVSPKDAAILSLAEARGTIIATLKNSDDNSAPDFSRLTMTDLFGHAVQLRQDAENKVHNRSVDGIHRDASGNLVTRDGVVITDPNVTLTDDGLLVTKDGTVLNGRGLTVDSAGHIRDAKGNPIDTASLVVGKDGSLVDTNGTVVPGNGYQTTKGGFLVDRDGRVLTPDGHVLNGVHLASDGTVQTEDGQVLAASDLSIDPDGTVHLVTPGPNGSAASAGERVTVDQDGTVRRPDGTIIAGAHLDADGNVVDADGKRLPVAISRTLSGVTATKAPELIAALTGTGTRTPGQVADSVLYQVEYIVGGAGDGAARTFMVKISD